MSRTTNSARNIIYGLISKGITVLLPFITRTVIIYYIGLEYAGLNSLFTSILNFLSLTELGFSTAVVYMLYKPVAENDEEQICAILAYLKKVYRAIGCIIFAIGFAIMPFLEHLISGEYPADINLYLLYFLYLVNTAVSYFLFAYRRVLFNAYQRVDYINKITSVVIIITGIMQILLIIFTRNYYLYVICNPIFTILQNICIGYWSKKVFPNLRSRGELDKATKKQMSEKVITMFGHKVGGTIVGSLDSIVISALLGLVVLAKYSNYYLVINALISVMTIILTAVVPSIGNYLITKSNVEIKKLFNKLNFGMVWMVGWCSVCLLCLYQPFVNIWLGEDALLPMSSVICLSLYFYSWQFRVMGANFKDAAGLWSEDVLKPYVASVVNVILNIILIHWIGLNGAFISTIFCMVCIYFPWETIVLHKKLFMESSKSYLFNQLVYFISWMLIGMITYVMCGFLPSANIYINFIGRMILCVVVPNILFILVFRKAEEFAYYWGFADKLMKKAKGIIRKRD